MSHVTKLDGQLSLFRYLANAIEGNTRCLQDIFHFPIRSLENNPGILGKQTLDQVRFTSGRQVDRDTQIVVGKTHLQQAG